MRKLKDWKQFKYPILENIFFKKYGRGAENIVFL